MSLTTQIPLNEMPQIQVLAGFGATSSNFPWTDISQFVRSGSINRQSNRLAGPLYQYQAGTCNLILKNGDARFDPDNLSGPYVTTQGLQTVTETITPSGAGAPSGTGNQGSGQNTGQSVSGQITIPANLNGNTIIVQCTAAGGGGGSGSNITQAAAGGGGGGAEFAAELALGVTPGMTYSYTIGLGGQGGTDNTRQGADGGDTTFTGDSVTVHAHGGLGGQTGTATGTGGSTGQFQGAGGNGGSGSANTQNEPGGAGGPGGQNNSGTTASGGGGGGSGGSGAAGQAGNTGDGKNSTPGGTAVIGGGPGGSGGKPKNDGSAPMAPPGGGGGGGSGERNGGNGSPGQIFIQYTVVVASSARTEVIPEVPVRVIAAYARNATVNFENGLGAWAASNGSIATDTTYSLWGQTSMKLTPQGAVSTPQVQSEMCIVGTAGVVSGSVWAFTPAGIAHSVKLDINYYDSNKSFLQNDGGLSVTLPAGVWTQVTNYNNSPPPGGAVYYALLFKINGTPASSEIVWLDQAVGAPGLAASAFPLFTGYVDSWADTGIMNPNDPLGPQTGPYQGYAETSLTATDAFEAFSLANLATLSTPVDSGNDAGGRIALILQSIGYPAALQQIDTSPVIVQGSDYGDNALDLMQTSATTDGGDLFIDGAGNVVFFTRNHVLSATSAITAQAVFGDRPGTVEPNGTELPYEGMVRITDNTTLFNDVQITPVSGTDPAATGSGGLQEVTDQSAVAQFLFIRSYTNSGTIQMFAADALSLAQWVLFIAKDDEDRIDGMTINPQRAPGDMYIQALGRAFTDRIEVWRRPAGMISPIVKPMGIRGISHTWDLSAKSWVTSWQLQDYTKYSSFMRLDDLQSGRLGYNAVAWG